MRAFALALLLAAPAAARDERTAAAEQAAIARASERGALIRAYDQAAWHGSDDMLATVAAPETKVAGYLAEGPANAPRLIFFDRQPTPHAYYVAQFRGTRLTSSRVLAAGEDRALSPENLRRLRALAVANIAVRQAGLRPCAAERFNTVVLPADPATGAIRVYYLSPQPDLRHVPFGGHYVVEVTGDGVAGAPRAFARSCLAMPVAPPPNARGAPAIGAAVTHLLDPVPTEIHVFSSLVLGHPVSVITTTPSPRIWTVDGTRIAGPRAMPAR